MKSRSTGFTMIELIIVILIGSLLTSMALSSFRGAQSALAVRSAKAMYATAQQRARSQAIESGETVIFVVDMLGDSSYQFSPSGISEVTRYRPEMIARPAFPACLKCLPPCMPVVSSDQWL